LKRYCLVIFMLFCITCGKKEKPAQLLPGTDKFLQIYLQYLKNIAKDSSKAVPALPQLDSLLDRSGLTRQQFADYMRWYTDHPELWSKALDMLIDSLRQYRKAELDSISALPQLQGGASRIKPDLMKPPSGRQKPRTQP
jgi:hypothetical protein